MNFIQQAYAGKNQWTLWLGTILMVLFTSQLLGVIPLTITAFLHATDFNEVMIDAENNFMNLGIDKNLYLFLIILVFIIGLVFLFIGVKHIHKRSLKSVITIRKKIDWKRFWFGFIAWGSVACLFIIIGILMSPEHYTYNFKAVPFFTLLLVSLLFLPLQTSFEELFFRGYLMQGLGILAKNRWVPLFITSILFGLLHFANPEVEKIGNIAMVFYIGTGFFYGITTLMDEGTELSLGLHAVNNIVAAFFVTADWAAFQTDALFIDTSEPTANWQLFLPVFILYPLMFFIFSKKYGWSNWKEKLFGEITKPTPNNLAEIGHE